MHVSPERTATGGIASCENKTPSLSLVPRRGALQILQADIWSKIWSDLDSFVGIL